ncbi:hypothetical protein [Massilia antarctica]|uniref:hypothetical protein n=1 Tax=Massilia antarctica TaxID=2765360 RepID=UPI00226DF06E|nr:hypothetical protein [Massilia sp. H27-R4]MCY0914543.1 hypothetical protein [Massilia sp. H27-R4]
MHIAERDRNESIAQLGVDVRVAFFLDCLKAPGSMATQFNTSWYFYSQGTTDNPEWPGLEDRRLLPLWEHFECVFAADLIKSPIEYVAFYIESPEHVRILGNTIYAPILEMIRLHTWEYGGELKEIKDAILLATDRDRLSDFPVNAFNTNA